MCEILHVIILGIILIVTSNVLCFGFDDNVDPENAFASPRVDREKRSYPEHPILDMLTQTMARGYTSKVTSDPFEFLRDNYDLPNGLKSPLPEYDYVIVGAGSAGCVLASRLTEDPNVTVLVLEVGKPEMFFTDVPSMAPYFQRTDYSWPYYMEPQKNVCLGMINKRCYWPRGRAVGGTSVINYMIYTRGRPAEWDRIAAAGNYGWSYKDVLKYYKKSERTNLEQYDYSPHRNTTGVMNVEFIKYKTRLIDAFLEAGRILGSPTVDYNAPEKLGFGYVQTTTRVGRRLSAAKAFLHPNKRRSNLHILPMATATKVLIDPANKSAYGVQFVRNRIKYEVTAKREVILSAGPVASPQLLMLSGIGPRDQLSRHEIPLIKDLPVGRTLYDHITFPGVIFTLNTTGLSFIETKVSAINNIFAWLQFGDGEVATPGAVEGIGYIKTPVSTETEDIPDIELISIGGSMVSDGGPGASKAVRRGMKISEDVFDNAFGSIDSTDTWSAFPMLLHPKSVGWLDLKDSNPFSHPRMYGNYLTDPMDVATLVAAIRYVQALAATPPFQKYGAKIHRAHYPGCSKFVFDSDEYWECAIRTLTVTLHHQIATCRMGPQGDPRAVVDPELRVHGVNRLRVVDSSIIPRTVSVHTHAPAVMIGEKAADMIKAAWK
ncbi:glucose dehydrogenase [FAD, quinone] isoform X2 [Manduca sexta]|uniref:glucose dehydrogenase [FAD, quinone] isoform X2 n=1 Tax=Manduca sexta TaxID=7130 RepID=UPI00188F643C|nr:glucose dehydrogenase [FAD, quinone] isoform X2 [Manduca sexta]